MNRECLTLCILLTLGLEACGPEPSLKEVSVTTGPVEESTSYTDQGEQRQFKEALKTAGVEYRVVTRDGREFVSWKPSDNEAVKRIQTSIFGPPLPSGRSLSLDAKRQEEFKGWLRANGIPFTIQLYRGLEYVMWEEEYTQKIKNSPYYPTSLH
jgi:hypothetical protein